MQQYQSRAKRGFASKKRQTEEALLWWASYLSHQAIIIVIAKEYKTMDDPYSPAERGVDPEGNQWPVGITNAQSEVYIKQRIQSLEDFYQTVSNWKPE